MSLKQLNWFLGVVVVIAALAAWQWQQRGARRLSAEIAALREDLRQAATVRETNEQVIDRLKAEAQRAEAERRELVRLRAQGARLQQAEEENARLKAERDQLVKRTTVPLAGPTPEAERSPEERFLAAKLQFARNLGLALILAADENEGRLPTEVPAALRQMVEVLSPEGDAVDANQFEVVYQGSLREVKKPSDTILVREKEPFRMADGRWARSYVFADGSARRLAADTPEGLALREKELSGKTDP